jgi:phospholipase/lecithinase/hemolysin
MTSLKSSILVVASTLLFAAPAYAAKAPFEGIVVFGTSLSDPGNGFVLRGGTNTPPEYMMGFLLVPDAPYARGGHHLSNGAPWIVQFARPLGLAGSVAPAYRDSSPNATNYAVDRARAWDDGRNVNLSDQVDQFLEDFDGVAPADRLYVLEIGSSDVRDALETYLLGGNGGVIMQGALVSIASQLTELYMAGARRFLIASVPDISLTPSIRTLDELVPVNVAQFASSLVQSFNTSLDGIVAQLPADTDVARLDIYGKLYDIVADAATFGLTNVLSPCITPDVPPFVCRNPDEYLFWDGIHPTEAVHGIFAQEARMALGL